jgi:hypothetical protein
MAHLNRSAKEMRITESFVRLARAVKAALQDSPSEPPQSQETPSEKEDDGLRVVGLFSIPEFKSLGSHFDARGIRFTPVFDTGVGGGTWEGFYEQRRITLFVDKGDVPAAAKAFAEWQIQVGRVGPEDADPATRANAAQRPS